MFGPDDFGSADTAGKPRAFMLSRQYAGTG